MNRFALVGVAELLQGESLTDEELLHRIVVDPTLLQAYPYQALEAFVCTCAMS
jgi:hypothetical protein